jgi:hypothetical protein
LNKEDFNIVFNWVLKIMGCIAILFIFSMGILKLNGWNITWENENEPKKNTGALEKALAELEELRSKYSGLANDSTETNSEPARNGEVIATEEKILGAGKFTVGKDCPPGRYRATNIGRGTNFYVYDSSDRLKVITILGNDGNGDYTFWAENGDMIDTRGKVKLIPVS